MIEMNHDSESGKSRLAVRHNDDDDDVCMINPIYTSLYIKV